MLAQLAPRNHPLAASPAAAAAAAAAAAWLQAGGREGVEMPFAQGR
jgi:hypothetical protein